jgi:hypothetical protein
MLTHDLCLTVRITGFQLVTNKYVALGALNLNEMRGDITLTSGSGSKKM